MADPCFIKSGEIVTIDDPRLSDTDCVIEAGVIIRPPADETTVKEVEKHVEEKTEVKEIKHTVKKRVELPLEPEPPPAVVETPPVKTVVTNPTTVSTAATAVPAPAPKEEIYFGMSPEMATVAAVGTIAAVGGAVAASTMGGFSAVQAKLASIFGSKAAATATAAVAVTAGTIAAVKALEGKVGKFEEDMKKAKEEVGGAASSIDRIDALLSRLGGDNDDELDPSV